MILARLLCLPLLLALFLVWTAALVVIGGLAGAATGLHTTVRCDYPDW